MMVSFYKQPLTPELVSNSMVLEDKHKWINKYDMGDDMTLRQEDGGMMVSFYQTAPPLHAPHSSPHLSNLRFHKRRDRKCEEIIVNTLFLNYRIISKYDLLKQPYFNNLSPT